MTQHMSRRDLLGRSAAALAGGVAAASVTRTAFAAEAGPKGKLKKALLWSMLPGGLSIADRFKLTADLGFDGIEGMTTEDQKIVDQMRAASDKARVPIHSVMNMGHWQHPLTSAKPEEVKECLRLLRVSLQNAKAWDADTVLLVPGVVNAETRYQDAYERASRVIREQVIPMAREHGVAVGIENVWNKFLLSPLEFAKFIDDFKDKHINAYFDIGNFVQYAYPEDWILTLGPRIGKLHLKDFKRSNNQFVGLGEGDVDWPAVRKAIDAIGFSGFLTAELNGGDEAYLRDVGRRIDQILQGLKPTQG